MVILTNNYDVFGERIPLGYMKPNKINPGFYPKGHRFEGEKKYPTLPRTVWDHDKEMYVIQDTKVCVDCGIEKHYSKFYADPWQYLKFYLHQECEVCHPLRKNGTSERKSNKRITNSSCVDEGLKRASIKWMNKEASIATSICSEISSKFKIDDYTDIKLSKRQLDYLSRINVTFDEFYIHFDKQLLNNPDMGWGNYGTFWEVDHHESKAKYNINHWDDPEYLIVFGLDNLKALSKNKNLKKGFK